MKGKYNFIKLEKVKIHNFSLYSKDKVNYEVSEIINKGVYCLAGANGLGKTTFLNAINYGLTGIVLEPNREVYSPEEIIKYNKVYTERYFSGRIKERDKRAAQIEITFSINRKFFRIIRGFFEREELRLFEVYTIENDKKIPQLRNKSQSPTELSSNYQQLLISEIGFDKFEYFIFYQLYILTFDENRRMMFWDERASQHTMALAFNTNSEDADRVIKLKRSMEKLESDARNARWQATQVKKKVEELLQKSKKSKDVKLEELEREYFDLYKSALLTFTFSASR